MKHAGPDPSTNDAPLRVERVAIFGLFGLYNHDIPLHMQERVTILHGPNGVGKTVLLRLIAAAFSGRHAEFAKVPFERLKITLSDGAVVTFKRTETRDNKGEQTSVGLELSLRGNDKTQHSDEVVIGSPELRKLVSRFAAETTYFAELGPDRWLDHRTEEELSTVEIYDRYLGEAVSGRRRPKAIIEPAWLTALRTRVQVHLIETQRLLRMKLTDTGIYGRRATTMEPTVRHYALDLQRRITEALARYATESQALDQSFPQRLLKAGRPPGLTLPDLKARMSDLDVRRTALQKLGLLDAATSSPFDVASLDALDPAQSSVMSLYVEDTQKKLAVLDDVSRRITLLLDIVNRKFRHKSIEIHREKGFVVVGHDKAPLEPDALSSGEQHELVLLYDLLFQVQPGTLVLIDEPELSLHVSWQKRFLSDLLEIAKTAQFDALIATHSPFIVGDRSDLMVALADDIDA